ncbi:MAG: BON domain-containing protein [Nitrospirae bacterium]|nr:BON domain-containing protein [Nitrospirota bacterium]
MWTLLSLPPIILCIFHVHSAIAAPDSGPAGESHHKESPPAEQKKKAEEKAPKAEEPPIAAPKPDESNGKKAVTSLNLTIKLALMANPSLFPFEMEVELDGPKAVLTGAVPSEDEKAQATEIIRKIEGVESVLNKLTVAPVLRSSLAKKQDDAVTQYVKERLSKSETLKAVGFEVKSESGVVSLSGKTRFQVIVLEAAEAARHIPGVRAVNTDAVQITGKE